MAQMLTTRNVRFLVGLPFVFFLELFFIWIPIAYHAGYGFYVWYRGESNVREYPWTGNRMYVAQRWTGAIAFFYMGWHVWSKEGCLKSDGDEAHVIDPQPNSCGTCF